MQNVETLHATSLHLPDQMDNVQPPLEFIPPALNPIVLRATQLLLPAWMRSRRTAITQIEADKVEVLVDLYRQFQEGKIRFLMAFRHPNADDPFCMAYLLNHILPRLAKEKNISLQRPIHAHFIYDRGIPLWAGAYMGWLYSRLGGTPIHRGKVDRIGLRSARDLFANASFPMAAAPEGATNGHNEVVSPLEPGIAQLGFWCVEDLLKAGRSEQVFIIPIGIQYRYVNPPWKSLSKLLSQLEADMGSGEWGAGSREQGAGSREQGAGSREQGAGDTPLSPSPPLPLSPSRLSPYEASLYQRLYRLGGHLLCLMEDFYTRFYHQTLSTSSTQELTASSATGLKLPISYKEFSTRLQALLDAALKVAEQYFDILPKGNLIDRCRRLEQAGWDYIYREDIKNLEALSPVERGLAARVAEEAALRMWHMRLVESFVAVTGRYVLEKPTAERFAETTLLMWDTIVRIKGGNPLHRPRLGKQRVQMTVGQPISVSDRWEAYQASRRGAKQAVADLTQDLQTALEAMIA